MKKIIYNVNILSFLLIFQFVQLSYSQDIKSNLKVETLPKALSFTVIGDWGRNGQFNQKETGEVMANVLNQLDGQFIISVGDNFYPDGVASVDDYHWLASFEQIYTDHALYSPWYVALGNHDYRGNVQAQIDYQNISRRWNLPARYYSKEFKIDKQNKLLVLFIDTNPFELDYHKSGDKYSDVAKQDTTAQKNWIADQLAKSNATWKIVVGHHPFYTSGKRAGKENTVKNSLEKLLIDGNVNMFIAGHEHHLEYNKIGNIHHFISGAGSAIRPIDDNAKTQFVKSIQGFMSFSFTPEKCLVQTFDYQGNMIYKTEISK